MDQNAVEIERAKLATMFRNIMKFEASDPVPSRDGYEWWYISITDIRTGCQIGRVKYRSRDGGEIVRYSWKTYDEKFYHSDPDWISKNHIRLAYYFKYGSFLFSHGVDALIEKAEQIRSELLDRRQRWRDAHPIARRRRRLQKPCIMPMVLNMLSEDGENNDG